MKKIFITILILISCSAVVRAQIVQQDSIKRTPNVIGGIYDRPYIYRLGGNIAIGGSAEMNSNFERGEGVEEGVSCEARRFNLVI